METITNVPLTQLHVDLDFQPRVAGIDSDYVQILEEVFDQTPPITVVRRGADYIPIDGLHRIAACQHLGRDTIQARIIAEPEDGDLYSLAFALNATHGKPLSLSDRRAYAERLLRSQPQLADREIGRRCGLSSNTVGSIRERLEDLAQIEQTTERIGRGGYTYSVGGSERQRDLGELPPTALGESVGQFFSAKERKQQRRIADYFVRLSAALEDQYDLEGFDTIAAAATACRLVLGKEEAAELGQQLGPTAHNTLGVALALGYERPDAAAEEDGE